MITNEIITDILAYNGPIQIVDIGANPIDGEPPYRPLMEARLGFITGFEPQESALAELLANKTEHENYLPYAVGDGARHTLYICNASGMTSCLRPDQKTFESFEMFKEIGKVKETVDLDTVRLDDITEISEIDFLKIDIQGGELAVFQNGKNKLADTVMIQTEISFINLYENQPSFSDIDKELRAQGFIPHCFAAVKNWPIAPALIGNNPYQALNQLLEADMVYVKDFTRDEKLSDAQLKKICIISHYCYKSFDLALRCIYILESRGVIAEGSQIKYLEQLKTG